MVTPTPLSRFLALSLSATLVIGPALRAEAMTGNERGTVRAAVADAETGAPVSGSMVRLIDLDAAVVVAETSTSESGVAVFADVEAGAYTIAVEAPQGYAASPAGMFMVGEGSTLNVETVVVAAEDDRAKGKVDSVAAMTIVLRDGTQVLTGSATVFEGDFKTLLDIAKAAEEDTICIEYVPGAPSTAVKAPVACDEAIPWLLLGALAGIGAGVACAVGCDPGSKPKEVVTQ